MYYVGCAIWLLSLALNLGAAGRGLWHGDWTSAAWSGFSAGIAAFVLWITLAVQEWTQLQFEAGREALRDQIAHRMLTETMLRHASEASRVEIGIGTVGDDDSSVKH